MRLVFVNVLVPWPSPLDSPSASFRRSVRVSPESKPEVEDDMWGHPVSNSAFKMNFLFSDLNEY